MANELNFHNAFRDCTIGKYRIRRASWEGTPCFVALAVDTAVELSKDEIVGMGRALICRTGNGAFVPWIPTQSDLLADDWQFLCSGSWLPCEPESSLPLKDSIYIVQIEKSQNAGFASRVEYEMPAAFTTHRKAAQYIENLPEGMQSDGWYRSHTILEVPADIEFCSHKECA